MAKTNRVQRQLIINVTLMLFTLLTLVACVTAWFSNRAEANIHNLNISVDRAELKIDEFTDNIVFPYAIKCMDTNAEKFKADVQVKTYKVNTDDQVYVDVRCDGAGMLAYIPWDNDSDYYGALIRDLTTHFAVSSDRLKNKSFKDIQTALNDINKKRIGTYSNQKTEFKIVYWVEYDQVKNLLNQESFWDPTNYKAVITVTG